ncbi:MAG: hydrogenase expression/formation protein HypE [Pirellulales bacterium]
MNNHPSSLSCPALSATDRERITLAHGEGGRLMRRLLHERIFPAIGGVGLQAGGDAAVLSQLAGEVVFTTDSFVVSPLFFPGGDIGKLCVFGTVNDLAVTGARPLWISLALIIEEGLDLEILDAVLQSIRMAASEAEVSVVTGDTKVVPRGAADGLFINTAGVGVLVSPRFVGPAGLQCGDELLVTGPIGQHGMAVMVAREQLELEPCPTSDCASLVPAVEALRRSEVPVVALRDATRGGVAAVLHEWAASCDCTLAVEEESIPVTPEVRGVCELLGLEPLCVANEGTMVVAVREGFGAAAAHALRSVPTARHAALIGRAQKKGLSPVLIQRGLGRYLPLDEPAGAPLPRIC